MNLRQLHFFVAVAEERSFTRGAQRVRSAQSAASVAVAQLEREFGQPLFDRTGHLLELTMAGTLLLHEARRILRTVNETFSTMENFRNGVSATLTLGTILSTGSLNLVPALHEFRNRYPSVVVRRVLSAAPYYDHASKVVDGTFDLAIVPMPGELIDGLVADEIAQVRMVLACARTSPLAKEPKVEYAQLEGLDFVDFPRGWGNRGLIDSLFRDRGVTRRVRVEVTDVESALDMISGRCGLGFVPEDSVRSRTDVAVVNLVDPPAYRRLGLLMKTDPAQNATKLLRGLLLTVGRAQLNRIDQQPTRLTGSVLEM